jgi:hypothetical protein
VESTLDAPPEEPSRVLVETIEYGDRMIRLRPGFREEVPVDEIAELGVIPRSSKSMLNSSFVAFVPKLKDNVAGDMERRLLNARRIELTKHVGLEQLAPGDTREAHGGTSDQILEAKPDPGKERWLVDVLQRRQRSLKMLLELLPSAVSRGCECQKVTGQSHSPVTVGGSKIILLLSRPQNAIETHKPSQFDRERCEVPCGSLAELRIIVANAFLEGNRKFGINSEDSRESELTNNLDQRVLVIDDSFILWK